MTATMIHLSPAAKAARTTERIEDLEFLLDHGEAPDRALARVGWAYSTAQRALHRRGRHDLAARLRGAA